MIGTFDEPARVERFAESWIEGDDDCWIWTKGYASNGYGIFTWSYAPGRRQVSAHVASYLLHHGELPSGHEVRHSCDNRRCVAPHHLSSGTRSDNVNDAISRGRLRPYGMAQKLTLDDVNDIRQRYAAGGVSQRELARVFGVTQPMIGKVVRGECWRTFNMTS